MTVSPLLALVLLAPSGAGDRVPLRLAERAEQPAQRPDAARPPAFAGTPATGVALFSMTGPDNGVCVRAVPDVNGDGLDEVVVGIDESGVPNVVCVDGASSGTAVVEWSLTTADGVSGGNPYGDHSLTPASDLDGNGFADLLVGTAWGGRTAYDLDTLDGSIRWRFDTYLSPNSGWVYSLAEMSDVTGDGVPEVAFGAGSFNDSVYLLDGASSSIGQASVVWQWVAGDAVYLVRNLGDANGDGDDDVLAAVGDDVDAVVCLDGGTLSPFGSTLWSYGPGITVYGVGVLPDITGDGVDEALAVLWAGDGSSVRCLNGATGGFLWASTAVNGPGMLVDLIEDVSGDGVPDVIASSWENAVTVLSGMTGALVWKTPVGTLNGGDVWTARAVGDLNGDGRQDVIAGSFDTNVYALDGDDGNVLWTFPTGNRVFSVAPVGDLNGDGRPEVGVATQDTTTSTIFWVLDGDAGASGPETYCTGKTNSLACVPFLTFTGSPSASSTSPFRIIGNDLVPNEAGFYLYGTQKANLSFHGGKLCVKAPLTRLLPPKNAGSAGTPPCSGSIARDFNAAIQSGSDPTLTAGATVRAQLRARDPLDPAGFGDSLTDALSFVIAP